MAEFRLGQTITVHGVPATIESFGSPGLFCRAEAPVPCRLGEDGPEVELDRFWVRLKGEVVTLWDHTTRFRTEERDG